MTGRLILSLCDYTGAWSRPYREAGYRVRQVDIKRGGEDVRLVRAGELGEVHGVLAAPPCTHFAGSGARWWEAKDTTPTLEGFNEPLTEGLSIVDACLRIIAVVQPQWWCLENPVGRLKHFIGDPVMTFQPCDFGDPYTKRTCLWGEFNTDLPRTPVDPTEGSKMHGIPPCAQRAEMRSETPNGFAQAFFKANP